MKTVELDEQTFEDHGRVWKITRLIFLSSKLEVFDLPLKALNVFDIFPKVKTTFEFVEHIKKVQDSDLKYPIILDEEGYVMDGRHRIMKALLENVESIKAVRFVKTPTEDYTKEPAK